MVCPSRSSNQAERPMLGVVTTCGVSARRSERQTWWSHRSCIQRHADRMANNGRMVNQPGDQHTTTLDALREFDRLNYQRRVRSGRNAWLTGFAIAVSIALMNNFFWNVLAAIRAGKKAFRPQWVWNYELDASTATAIVVGMAAVTATINVALVASAWRPRALDTHIERRVEDWTATMRRASMWASTVSVASVLLIDHKNAWTGVVLFLVSFLTTMIAAFIVERRSHLSADAEERDLKFAVLGAKSELAEYQRRNDHKYNRDFSPKSLILAWLTLVMLPPLIGAVSLAVAAGVWVSRMAGSEHVASRAFVSLLAGWLSFSGSLSVVLVIALGALAFLHTYTAPFGRSSTKVTMWIVVGVLLAVSLLPLAIIGYEDNWPRRVFHVISAVVPSVVSGLLLLGGWRGRWPGAVFWSTRYRTLQLALTGAEGEHDTFKAEARLLDELASSDVDRIVSMSRPKSRSPGPKRH